MSLKDWQPTDPEPFFGADRNAVAVRLLPTRKRGWVERVSNWLHSHPSDAQLALWTLNMHAGRGVAIEYAASLRRNRVISAQQYRWVLTRIWERWPLTIPKSEDALPFEVGMTIERQP